MPQNKNPAPDAALKDFLTENGINNKELLSTIIAMLQKFCQDNMLSLQPLLQDEEVEGELNQNVQERLCCFAMISNLLGGIDKLVKADVTFSIKGSKKKSKKKHKKKRD